MKLIKNDLYLLLIDEEAEIKFNDLMYDSKLEIVIRYNSYNDGCYKIIAYYPLKEATELDLPLLPKPFEEDNPFLNGTITKATCYTDNGTFYIEELKKLFETQPDKQFSLEDMKEAFVKGAFTDLFNTLDISKEDFAKEKAEQYIQSLSTQQLPKEFVGWISKKKCPYDFTSRCTIDRCDCEFVFETTTNSEGKEVLIGTYKY